MKILLLIIAQILGEAQFDWIEDKEVGFDKLPAICQKAYDKDLFELWKPKTTKVAFVDMDGDNQKEIISWDGQQGTGGMGWNIISNDKVVDNVFGSIAMVKNGVLVKNNQGWENASFNYYELQDKKLVQKYEIEVTYYPPKDNVLHKKVKIFEVKMPKN